MYLSKIQRQPNILRDSQRYDRNTFLWGPDNGDPILAKDLSVQHLANVINWIQDHPAQYSDAILNFMIGEAGYRRLAAFTNDDPYVIINDQGRAEVIRCTQDRVNVKNMRIGARK